MNVERIQIGAGIVVLAVTAFGINRHLWKPACAVVLAGAAMVVAGFVYP